MTDLHPEMVANLTYKERFNFLMKALLVAMALLLLAMLLVMYQVSHQKPPLFFAEAPNNQRMPLEAFITPTFRSDVILRWATKGALAAYTFDFANYQSQVAVARPYFTDAGWNDYQRSVAHVISTVVANQLFVNSVVSEPPIIVQQGPSPEGGYLWRVQIPFLVNYVSTDETQTKHYTVIVTLVKVPTSSNPAGIGIDRFVMV